MKITKGIENASPMGWVEWTRFKVPVPTPITPGGLDPVPCLAYIGNEDTMRLACQTLVQRRHGSRNRPRAESLRREFLQLERLNCGCSRSLAATPAERVDHRFDRPPMKQVIAIVKPFLVEKILEALRRAPLEAVSVREVKGMGKQKTYLDAYADTEYSQTFLPKVEITLWVDDTRAEDVARKIVEIARTGRMGDGKIFILPAESYEAVIDIAG